MNISEQAKELRDCVHRWQNFESVSSSEPFKLLSESADTIESLSAKLAAVNTERDEILKGIRKKAQELSSQHWGDDERHLISKGIQCMCVQAENIIKENMRWSDRYYAGNRKLEEGDVVQHFKRETVKDKEHNMEYLYIIEAIATNTETKEKLVIYRALYKNDDSGVNFDVFARPYDMFVAEVDHEKYPKTKQKYRFELFKSDRS